MDKYVINTGDSVIKVNANSIFLAMCKGMIPCKDEEVPKKSNKKKDKKRMHRKGHPHNRSDRYIIDRDHNDDRSKKNGHKRGKNPDMYVGWGLKTVKKFRETEEERIEYQESIKPITSKPMGWLSFGEEGWYSICGYYADDQHFGEYDATDEPLMYFKSFKKMQETCKDMVSRGIWKSYKVVDAPYDHGEAVYEEEGYLRFVDEDGWERVEPAPMFEEGGETCLYHGEKYSEYTNINWIPKLGRQFNFVPTTWEVVSR